MSRTPSHPGSEPCDCHEARGSLSRRALLGAAATAAAVLPHLSGVAQAAAATRTDPLTWDDLVPGFVATTADPWGQPPGTGFVAENPWGHYTAYRVARSSLGHRTWRIENMMPTNAVRSQGSTMWLFEGSARALLVDTAQNTPDVVSESDLKLVVRHLLGHEDDGSTRPNPVDFDVAITHSHGDHTGKNAQMSDRTVYYPELDWPTTDVPSFYVPVREGGGTSAVFDGDAVGEFDLGGRLIRAVAMYGHTPGSTGYLDVENLLLATGDALGSGFVWAHFASATTSTYRGMLTRLQDLLRPLEGIALLPAHYYQIEIFDRGLAPLNGRNLDAQYVDDMHAAATAVLDGSVAGEPYRTLGRETVWLGVGSARMTYSLTNLYPGGPKGGDTGDDSDAYHLVAVPGSYRTSPETDAQYAFLDNVHTGLHVIRDSANQTMVLVQGSERSLLIGTGRGTRGLGDYVRELVGGRPLEVVVTGEDPTQLGGLPQFADHLVHVPQGSPLDVSGLPNVSWLHDEDLVPLGTDDVGRSITLEVYALPGSSPSALTLLDPVSRVLFAGEALGEQGATGGVALHGDLTEFSTALTRWRSRTNGRYDTLYTAHNHQWHTTPLFVDSLQTAVTRASTEGSAAYSASPRIGYGAVSAGTADNVALVLLPLRP